MKNKPIIVALLLLTTNFFFAQNDCVDAIVVCSNLGFENLDVSGAGIQELSNSNACELEETNSLWLDLTINTGGTLGFVLTPTLTDISEDYDFFVFGPNPTCNNIGQSIRCSTTNPINAGLSNNLTGMNDTETDTSEGPGADGNSFVRSINVSPGERYFIVIDRPLGVGGFDLEWTGTATFNAAPNIMIPQGTNIDLEECDVVGDPNDESTSFDLTVNSDLIIGAQTGVTLTYHTSNTNAQTGNGIIGNPAAFSNAFNPQTIYVRLENDVTGCFSTDEFEVRISGDVDTGIPNNLTVCDDNNDGVSIFDLTQNDMLIANGIPSTTVTFYLSEMNAENDTNPIASMYQNQNAYIQETIWARLTTAAGCFGVTSFTIQVFESPTANVVEDQFICDDNNDGLWSLNLDDLTTTVLGTQNDMLFNVTYHPTQEDADTNMNALVSPYTNQTEYVLETIFVRIENNENTECFDTTSFDFDVFDQPIANTVANYELCDDTSDGDDANGFTTFNLSTLDIQVLGVQDMMQFNITYYQTLTDANDAMNELPNMYTNTDAGGNAIAVRIENVDNPTCFSTGIVNVVVNPLPVITTPVSLRQCDDDTDGISDFNLTEANSLISVDAANETFTYHNNFENAEAATNAIPTPTAYTAANSGKIFVRIETVNGCFRIGEINLIVAATQIPDTFQIAYEVCDNTAVDGDNTNGVATFDFSDAEAQINALFTATGQTLTITYYENFADALAEENAIPDISNHRNDASPDIQNIVVRVDSDVDNACLGLGEHITLTVNPLPDQNTITDYIVCNDDANQFTFDLSIKDSEVINGQTNIDLTYHESQVDADTNINAIVSPYTTSSRTIYVRAINTVTSCINTAMNFELIINENPTANMPTDLIVCDNDPFDGIFASDLNSQSAQIIGTQMDVSVQYYLNQADAENNTNPLASPYTNTSNPQTIYARIENGTTGCFNITNFDIIVSEAPITFPATALEYCDTDNDGIGVFNLTTVEDEVTGGMLTNIAITYHETPEDAINNVNALADIYSNINPETQTIHVRVENVLTGCFNVVDLILIVHDSPEIAAIDATSLSECDDVTADQIAQFDLTESETDILNGEDPTTHTVRYYNTQANAVAGTTTGEINNTNAYSNIPPSPQVIWVRVEDQVTGCASITNLTLIVNELPVLVQLPGLELCDAITLNDETEVFDLTSLA
ncbi:MAG: hypothetical protein AB8B65_14380, partial [Kordia sp.]